MSATLDSGVSARTRQPAADALSNSYTLSLLLLDDVLMGIFCMIPVVLAAERSLNAIRKTEDAKKNGAGKGDEDSNDSFVPPLKLEASLFVIFPLAASVMLTLLYFFFAYIDSFMVVYTACACILACAFALQPLSACVSTALCSGREAHINLPAVGSVAMTTLVAFVWSFGLVLAWLLTAHWMLFDALGIGLLVFILCHVRLPSLRVAAAIFMGLVVYDVFWVFFSARFFKDNVMVEVALRKAHNPVGAVAKKIGLPGVARSPTTISLPGKLIFHGVFSPIISFLGLGDVVVPGVVICYAKWFDYQLHSAGHLAARRRNVSYFTCSLASFFVGLMMSSIASLVYRVAQPAMIYLVPTSLLPLMLLGLYRGELRAIWYGERLPGTSAPLIPV